MAVNVYPERKVFKIQEFASSGSWTVPAGVYSVEVEIAGGGGGGGGVAASADKVGGGGGGGAYYKSIAS